MSGALVTVTDDPRSATAPATSVDVSQLSGSQKAAIIVQMILSRGGKVDLSSLAPAHQVQLATDYAGMVRVNQATMQVVLASLEDALDQSDLIFPEAPAAALDQIEDVLSAETSPTLRDQFGLSTPNDPWQAAADLSVDDIANRLETENPQIGAVVLSKLNPEKAGDVLAQLPEPAAMSITLAIAKTARTGSAPADRIGAKLTTKSAGTSSPKAFAKDPVARTAAILNAATASQRDELINVIEMQDAGFAADVRKAIFTFADISERLEPVDVPKFTRDVPQDALITALVAAGADHGEVVSFILDNMSQRMADQLRDEMSEMGEIDLKPGEAAMGQVTSVIRALVDQGEIKLIPPQADGEAA